MSDERDYLWDRSGPVDPFVARMEETMSVLAEPPHEPKARALTPKGARVLRVAVVTDGKVCDELHQVRPGTVSAGSELGNKLVVFDANARATDYRKHAPIWLGLGLALSFAGVGLFGLELDRYAEHAEQVEAARELTHGEITAFEAYDSGGRSDLGIALILAGLVPLVAGVMGLGTAPPRRRKERRGPPAPHKHALFDCRNGVYYLDLPAHARGKISLGRKAATVSQLRKRFGRGDRLRVKLNPNAKGKLILGDTTLLFQFAPPAPVPRNPPLPANLVNPWRLLALSPLAALAYLGSLVVLGGFFFYNGFIAEGLTVEASDRFADVMGIAKYEPEEEEEEKEPEEEEEEDQLAIEDDEPEETDEEIEEKLDKILDKKPQQFSDQAVKEARGVGVARVLGTYGGPGEGSVFDIIQDTENNLGDLMADGTSIIESDAGSVSDFVPGGKGISAQGGMVQGDKIGGSDQPALAEKTKKEKKIKPKMSSSTNDIYGDVDKKAVQATIRRRTSALKVCYEKALRTQPGLKGKITYTIAISTVGRVTRVEIEDDTLGDASVRSCTQAKIKGWRFPAAGAQETAEVTFSVVYSGAQ